MLMRAALIWTVNLVLVVNGGAMLVFPETWFGLIPSVADTGPFNPHFVRDVGSAYLVAGGGLIWFWLDKRARPAAVAGAAFLALHALVHVWDAAAGRESSARAMSGRGCPSRWSTPPRSTRRPPATSRMTCRWH
jgi:uncharacterized protein YjeT (DUF2065 family)